MPTTTIRLDDALKERVAAAAQRAGVTAHAYIVEAIANTVAQSEVDHEFDQIADQRWANLLATGRTVSWEEGRRWLLDRANVLQAAEPKPRKRRR